MKKLMAKGADPNCDPVFEGRHPSVSYDNAFTCALKEGLDDVASYLLNPGKGEKRVDVKDRRNFAAAILYGSAKLVEEFLKAGADPKGRNLKAPYPNEHDGYTPAHFTAEAKKDGVLKLKLLAMHGADLNATIAQTSRTEGIFTGCNVLHLHAFWGNNESVAWMVKHPGVDVRAIVHGNGKLNMENAHTIASRYGFIEGLREGVKKREYRGDASPREIGLGDSQALSRYEKTVEILEKAMGGATSEY